MYSPEAGDGNYQSGFRSVEAADEKLCGGRSRGSSPCDSLTRGGDSNICWTRIGDSALESSYYLVEENTTSLRPKKEGKKKKERKKEQEEKEKTLHCIPFTSITMPSFWGYTPPQPGRITGSNPLSQESMDFKEQKSTQAVWPWIRHYYASIFSPVEWRKYRNHKPTWLFKSWATFKTVSN